jgi:hypothetical protein
MTRRQRDLERLLTAIARQAGAKLVELRQTNGGHTLARFDHGGPVFLASTPSDNRALKNVKAQAKRALRG